MGFNLSWSVGILYAQYRVQFRKTHYCNIPAKVSSIVNWIDFLPNNLLCTQINPSSHVILLGLQNINTSTAHSTLSLMKDLNITVHFWWNITVFLQYKPGIEISSSQNPCLIHKMVRLQVTVVAPCTTIDDFHCRKYLINRPSGRMVSTHKRNYWLVQVHQLCTWWIHVMIDYHWYYL